MLIKVYILYMHTRIKICGITRIEDALLAAKLGADAIGLVFYPQSPRCVSIEIARAIVQALPPFITVVGLFVDANKTTVQHVLQHVPLNLLQLHGDENAELCESYGISYIKALRVRAGVNLNSQIQLYKNARGILLDAYHPTLKGGTGQMFDWDLIPHDLAKPIILAGGLTADNVVEAITKVKPYAVDVSSGVESSPGIKDPIQLTAFIHKVRHGNPKTI